MEYLLLTAGPQSREIGENNILSTVQNVIWFFDLGSVLVCPIIALHFYQVLLPTHCPPKKNSIEKDGVKRRPPFGLFFLSRQPINKVGGKCRSDLLLLLFPAKKYRKKAFFGWWSRLCLDIRGGGIPSRCCKGGGMRGEERRGTLSHGFSGEERGGKSTRLEKIFFLKKSSHLKAGQKKRKWLFTASFGKEL